MRSSCLIRLRMKAVGPISHFSDERAGNSALIRRIAVLHGGTRVQVPVVSGNSLRGQLRRAAAQRLCDLADLTGLTAGAYHLVFSGGALTRGESDHAHRVSRIRLLRECLPIFGLFGGSLGSEIVPGCLRVGLIWPVCSETAQFTGQTSDLAASDLVTTVYYTRRDDGALSPVSESEPRDSQQMIFECEGLAPGTRLEGEIRLERATEVEVACLCDALQHWASAPRLGGMSSRGHGSLSVELEGMPSPELLYEAHIRREKSKIAKALAEVA